ncbi:uncharacterized protein LOC135707118 [Ochlerotatus camptorhynchus]|uniref:uncharacterized protein LOC135707118 n=1 Tax=Ochlerotatus camptorhynchus TaxID=644619 RepID=UPI0031D7C7E4
MANKAEKKLEGNILILKRVLAIRDVVERFVAEYDHERDANQVSVRLETLDKVNKEFQQVQGEIEKLDVDQFEDHIEVRTGFENRYCVLKGFLLSKMDNGQPPLNSTMINTFAHHTSSSFHHRLPKIDLPKFSGDESRWISFRDNFLSMIHSNEDIPTVNKLQYLLQSLEGEAKKPFESVDIQADNYASTWDALMKRYDNKRFLRKELFRGLFELPPIKRESAQELNTLVDEFQRHVKALGKLGEPVKHWNTPLTFILCNKLDASTLRSWEQETRQKDDVSYDELIEFLIQQVRMLKSVSSDLQHRSQGTSIKVAGLNPKKLSTFKSVVNAATSEVKSNTLHCPACSEKHLLHQCSTFNKLSVSQRRELVTQRSLCWNCFRSGHQARACKSKFSCRTCQARHHTSLHDAAPKKTTPAVPSNPPMQQPAPSTSAHAGTSGSAHPPEVSMAIQSNHSTVLLETVVLIVVDQHGKEFTVRALLDSASMSNFITKRLANALVTQRTAVDVAVSGLGESVKQIKRQITATIKSKTNTFSSTLEFLVMKKPSANLPTIAINTAAWNLPSVPLADPHFNIPGMIDIIIGGECYHEIHTGNRIALGNGLPLLVETHFGWAISGKTSTNSAVALPACYISTTDRSLESALQRFWELEAVDNGPTHSSEEKLCEEIYATTTTRTHDGRYVVRLPRSEDPQVTLGESREIAIRRFYSLERRLERDPALKKAYHDFVEEYLRLDHMRKLDSVDDEVPHCYLPHHPVFKESSTTTKVRVVFDASCKTSSGMSLNDILLVGPVVQQNLDTIIIRFRFHVVAIVADVEKMYRQIFHFPADQNFLRILFRRRPSDPIDTYELLTVTYGTSSAPFLATRTLQQLAKDEGDIYPEAVEAVVEDFYVDDLLTGADNLESAIEKRRQISAMLASAGLPLKKWASNVPEALADIPPEDLAIKPFHDLQDDQSVSTLGLVWDTKTDMLRFNVDLPLPAPILTKRKVISYIAKIFDPLGLVGPTIATAKLFMQRLWKLKNEDNAPYEWDRPLPQKLQDEWKQFHATLPILADIRIPRFVSLAAVSKVELHFFCDASDAAYGACCFIRSLNNDQVKVQLLTSKSKVAPLATKHTIARLELCAAVLSTKLYQKVEHAIKLSTDVYFWTDSTTVIQWLQSPPNRWKTFVANRVSTIQSNTEIAAWRHVPGVENPADELSRGLQPADLVNQSRWWNGPKWLWEFPAHWPVSNVPEEEYITVIEEARKVTLISLNAPDEQFANQLLARFSNYTTLRRVVAYCMKYIKALQATVRKSTKSSNIILTTADLVVADHTLIRLAQSQLYSEELAELTTSTSNDVLKSSPLKWLKPHVDDNGIIRVGGRLSNAEVPDTVKYPMVLSSRHPLAQLLAGYYHKFLLHAGPQLMLATMRQKYWIISGRNLVRHTYHQCVKCFRNKPILIQQSVADLPKSRVTPSRPFAISGVDYCGPVYLKSSVRNRGPTKAYIAIFVCFSTKAVHIELVTDLSTPAFLAALRRFVARRGLVRELHSDNGTAFKGAANALHRIYEMLKSSETDRAHIQTWCAKNQIQWKFTLRRIVGSRSEVGQTSSPA